MGKAAADAGVGIVTGDTKVVGKGGADQLFVNTAGVGVVPAGVRHRTGAGPPRRPHHRLGQHRRARRGDHERARGHRLRHHGHHRQRAAAPAGGGDAGGRAERPRIPYTRCAIRPAAAWWRRSSRSPAPPGSGIELDERRDPGARDGGVGMRLPGAGPAAGGQRGQAGGVRRPRRTARRCWPRCARGPRAPVPRSSAGWSTNTPGWRSGRTTFGTTRVIERELGEQLPRIC